MVSIFCIYCGVSLPSEAAYCFQCGRQVYRPSGNPVEIRPAVEYEPTDDETIEDIHSLAIVQKLAASADPSTKPTEFREDDRKVIFFKYSRLAFPKDIYDNLAAKDVVVQRVTDSRFPTCTIAWTRSMARKEVGNVFLTDSYRVRKLYTYSVMPENVKKYIVE